VWVWACVGLSCGAVTSSVCGGCDGPALTNCSDGDGVETSACDDCCGARAFAWAAALHAPRSDESWRWGWGVAVGVRVFVLRMLW